MNAQLCDKLRREGHRPAFSCWRNRLARFESLPCKLDTVHHNGGVDVVVGLTCPNVSKLPRDGDGGSRVRLSRVERKASVVQCRRKVGSLI